MKYVQPYGISNPDAPYINGDPSIGRMGSIPPAEAFEHPMREIVGVIVHSDIAPSGTDLLQLAKGVRSQSLNYTEDVGSTNAMVVAADPPLTSYTKGLPLRVKVLHTNTSSTVTLNAGAGPATVVKMDGGSPSPSELPAGGIIEVTWDGTRWQLTNFGGAGGGPGTIYQVYIPYVVDTSPTPDTIIAPFSPAITNMAAGFVCLVKIANTNTGLAAVKLKVNALPDATVVASDSGPCLPADLIKDDIVLFKYDGTKFIADTNVAVLTNINIPVPSAAFPNIEAVWKALKRKTIAPDVKVTVKLAAGIYAPFRIYHPFADRVVVQGTMIGPPPGLGDFSSSDDNYNLAMLRTRYGTEVQVNQTTMQGNTKFSPFYCACIWNDGPGDPLVKDILVTGTWPASTSPGGAAGGGLYAEIGIFAGTGSRISCQNVAGYKISNSFTSIAGNLHLVGGPGTYCYGGYGHTGFNVYHKGQIQIDCQVFSWRNWNGIISQGGGSFTIFGTCGSGYSYVGYNVSGVLCYAHSEMSIMNMQAVGNGAPQYSVAPDSWMTINCNVS